MTSSTRAARTKGSLGYLSRLVVSHIRITTIAGCCLGAGGAFQRYRLLLSGLDGPVSPWVGRDDGWSLWTWTEEAGWNKCKSLALQIPSTSLILTFGRVVRAVRQKDDGFPTQCCVGSRIPPRSLVLREHRSLRRLRPHSCTHCAWVLISVSKLCFFVIGSGVLGPHPNSLAYCCHHRFQ